MNEQFRLVISQLRTERLRSSSSCSSSVPAAGVALRERQAAIAAIKASGTSPMAFFADLLGNQQAPLELRFQAAKELAPYVHPKLASIESRTGGMTHEDRLEQLRRLAEDDD
jgi:hypothetical protein